MGDGTNGNSRKTIGIRIMIVFILILVVAGIWAIKNTGNDIEPLEVDDSDFGLHVTGTLDIEKLKSHGLPIIIDFGADSCVPCKQMAPVLEELNKELQGKAIIKFVDVWKYKSLVEGYPINVIPTQIFIDASGNPYQPKDPEKMEMKLYSLKETGEHVFTAHEGGMTKEQLYDVLAEMGVE